MTLLEWMTKPHFPPWSVFITGGCLFVLGWNHQWWWALTLAPVSIVGEYFLTDRARSTQEGDKG